MGINKFGFSFSSRRIVVLLNFKGLFFKPGVFSIRLLSFEAAAVLFKSFLETRSGLVSTVNCGALYVFLKGFFLPREETYRSES
jgi:hypothetical protein